MVKCTPLPQPHLNEFCTVSLMHGKCATYLQLENKGWSSGVTGTPVSSWTATYCWPTGKLTIFRICRMRYRLLPKFNELFSGHNLPISQISNPLVFELSCWQREMVVKTKPHQKWQRQIQIKSSAFLGFISAHNGSPKVWKNELCSMLQLGFIPSWNR